MLAQRWTHELRQVDEQRLLKRKLGWVECVAPLLWRGGAYITDKSLELRNEADNLTALEEFLLRVQCICGGVLLCEKYAAATCD
jgi:hypothetical protein